MAKFGSGKTSQTFLWILMGLLFVGLAGFGAGGFGGSIRSVGAVGDTEIELNTYAQQLSQELRALRAQTGQNVTVQQGLELGLDQVVLRRLVDQAALEGEAARIGLSVGDEQVRAQVLNVPGFSGLDGNFDREAYQATLRHNGTTVARFEDGIRKETARTLLQGTLAGSLSAPASYAETIVGFVGEGRDITYALLGEDNLETPLPDPTDAVLTAYYDENPEQFTTPEARRLTYVWLTPNMLLDTIEVEEDVLRDLYEERSAFYNMPERRLVERLVFPDDAAAEAAKTRLDAEEVTFEDLVAERGLDLEDTDLGDVALDALGDAGADVFALTEPGLAGPLPTSLGPAIFRVNAILAARETPFEDAAAALREEYARERARRLISEFIEQIDDLLAGGATLEEIADETEMELGEIDWHAAVSDGPAAYQSFRTAAAQAQSGDFPEILELDDGGLFALRLDEIVPPTLQPFEDVREEALTAWQTATTAAALAEQANTIAGRLSEGVQLDGMGLDLRTEEGLTRDGFVQDMPADFVETIFTMEPGAVEVIEGAGNAVLVRLDAINAADPEDPETSAILEAVSAQAQQTIAQDALGFFARAIETREGFTLNPAALQAVHSQLQ